MKLDELYNKIQKQNKRKKEEMTETEKQITKEEQEKQYKIYEKAKTPFLRVQIERSMTGKGAHYRKINVYDSLYQRWAYNDIESPVSINALEDEEDDENTDEVKKTFSSAEEAEEWVKSKIQEVQDFLNFWKAEKSKENKFKKEEVIVLQ